MTENIDSKDHIEKPSPQLIALRDKSFGMMLNGLTCDKEFLRMMNQHDRLSEQMEFTREQSQLLVDTSHFQERLTQVMSLINDLGHAQSPEMIAYGEEKKAAAYAGQLRENLPLQLAQIYQEANGLFTRYFPESMSARQGSTAFDYNKDKMLSERESKSLMYEGAGVANLSGLPNHFIIRH